MGIATRPKERVLREIVEEYREQLGAALSSMNTLAIAAPTGPERMQAAVTANHLRSRLDSVDHRLQYADSPVETAGKPVFNCGHDPTSCGWIIREGSPEGQHVATFRNEEDANAYVRMRGTVNGSDHLRAATKEMDGCEQVEGGSVPTR